jgi:transposase
VGRWQQTLTSGGQRSLRGAPRTGRPPLLDANDQKRLIAALKAGALAQGYSSDLWTLGRVGKLIEMLTGQRYCESGVWRLLKRLGFSSQRPAKRAMQRDETAVRQWKSKPLAGAQKKAAREGRIIIFIDESGISERPHRVSTWAPKGQTPVLQYSFTWKQLSAVAGVSFWNIYFKLVQGAVRAPKIVAVLKALRRHLGDRKLLIVWDRLQAHRSRLVREYVESQEGTIHLEFLPPYAPELNPVEYLWAHWKHTNWPTSVPRSSPN